MPALKVIVSCPLLNRGANRKMDKLLIFQQRPADQFRRQGIALIQRLGLLYISVAVYTSHKIKPLVIIAVAHPQFPGISQRFIRSSIGHKTKIRRSYPGISEGAHIDNRPGQPVHRICKSGKYPSYWILPSPYPSSILASQCSRETNLWSRKRISFT